MVHLAFEADGVRVSGVDAYIFDDAFELEVFVVDVEVAVVVCFVVGGGELNVEVCVLEVAEVFGAWVVGVEWGDVVFAEVVEVVVVFEESGAGHECVDGGFLVDCFDEFSETVVDVGVDVFDVRGFVVCFCF